MNKYFVQWTEKVTKKVTYSAFIEAENSDVVAKIVETNLDGVICEDYYVNDIVDSEFIGIDLITKVK